MFDESTCELSPQHEAATGTSVLCSHVYWTYRSSEGVAEEHVLQKAWQRNTCSDLRMHCSLYLGGSGSSGQAKVLVNNGVSTILAGAANPPPARQRVFEALLAKFKKILEPLMQKCEDAFLKNLQLNNVVERSEWKERQHSAPEEPSLAWATWAPGEQIEKKSGDGFQPGPKDHGCLAHTVEPQRTEKDALVLQQPAAALSTDLLPRFVAIYHPNEFKLLEPRQRTAYYEHHFAEDEPLV
eukprot:s117_g8.t1